MPRQPSLAILLGAGAVAAALALAAAPAGAQSVRPAVDASLLNPLFDGDPRNPPRFRSPRKTAEGAISRFGRLPNFDYQPALGAGTTGFDSTNARKRKAKSSQAARPGGAVGPGSAQLPTAAAARTAATTGTDGAPRLEAPSFTPRQLQPPGGPIAGRIFNQNRPGAPPAGPDAVIATIATTPPSRRQPAEDKPFEPLGIQAGAFIFRPAFEYTRGYDNNPARASIPPAARSWYDVYVPELQINSNWARHEFTASLRGSHTTYDSDHSLDRPTVDAKANLRIDVTSQDRIELEGRYLLFTDSPGSPNIQADLAKLPIAMTYGSTAGVGHRFNRFEVTLKGSFDRTVYNDSEFIDGQTASNADRNFNKYGTQLRTSYEVLPGLKPFVEVGADRRMYDLEIDTAGVNRSSRGYNGKIGTTLEFRPKLTGEVSFGYLTRTYEDPALEDIRGPTVDASLTWLASALTTVKLTAATAVMESTLAGVSGAFTRDVTLQVDHAFRRWLIATLKFTRGIDDYVGSPREDLRYLASSALVYLLTREVQLKGEYRQEWRFSNIPGNDYWAHVWLVGIKLQR